ncbi:MAG TPA: NAD(P)H-dependent oxidoreductase [Flavitalea sp.]|nr:NAD(P)H-dependent oxidoreductase [Flavitalea sp.]
MEERYIIISGTNRRDSNTRKVARQYQDNLTERNISSEIVTLEGMDLSAHTPEFEEMEKNKLLPAKKLVFIVPEYNGSIPGVLKTMLDLSDYKKTWQWKKALLVGISTGRSGNVRGLEHLTSILNYMKVVVHPNKLPISSVHKLLNGKNSIEDSETLIAINIQIDEFVKF